MKKEKLYKVVYTYKLGTTRDTQLVSEEILKKMLEDRRFSVITYYEC